LIAARRIGALGQDLFSLLIGEPAAIAGPRRAGGVTERMKQQIDADVDDRGRSRQ
jgi:hypothetical protein